MYILKVRERKSLDIDQNIVTPVNEPTLKNRERQVIRNKRLSIEKEIWLPTVNYKVDKKLKAPEMWQRGQEIKMQVINNSEKHVNLKKSYQHYLSSKESRKDIFGEESPTRNLSRANSLSIFNSITGESSNIKPTNYDIDYHDPFARPYNIANEVANRKLLNLKVLKKPLIEEAEIEPPLPKQFDPNFPIYPTDFQYPISTRNEDIQKELDNIKQSEFPDKYGYLNALHRKVQNSYKKKDAKYKNAKDVYSQYKQRKILNKYDYAISSNLYVMNQNPMFQINNSIAFPIYLKDAGILGNVYDVNMYNLKSLTDKYVKRAKESGVNGLMQPLVSGMKALNSLNAFNALGDFGNIVDNVGDGNGGQNSK
jgi:hypothetical protein